jgi:glycosyltransferase involved in cell wall biosynthesis
MTLFNIKSLGEITFRYDAHTSAEVVVVVPLYNYAKYIIECLDSIAVQTIERCSVVVVDDCSTDNGAALATDFLKTNSSRFSSVIIIRHTKNQGLSMARNSGIAWSSEPFLFMLDADNRIRSPALDRLKNALEFSEADFAYSQLFIFGEANAIGRADIWNVNRLRHGNTIDAMALICRRALIATEGYAVLADDHGWEDYDLWCRFFTLNFKGIFVPELLCEYRQHKSSMLNTHTNNYVNSLKSEMAIRHPNIFCFSHKN